MNIEAFRQISLGSIFQAPILDDSIRRLSVVKGLTLAPVSRDKVPPQVEVFLRREEAEDDMIFRSNPKSVISEDRVSAPRLIPEDIDGVFVCASIELEGKKHLLASTPLAVDLGMCLIEVRLSGNHLITSLRRAGREPEKLIDIILPDIGEDNGTSDRT